MSTLNEISQMVITGQIRTIKAKVQQALDEGIGAQEILDGGLLPGINEIGEKFARNEVFVPNVLLAAKVMNMGVEVIQPLLAAGESTKLGTAVVGTVKGDLHDIGKNLVALMMRSANLEVIDEGEFYETNDRTTLEGHFNRCFELLNEYLAQQDKYYGPIRLDSKRIIDVMSRE